MLQLFKVMRSFLVTLYRVQGVLQDLYTGYRVSQRTFIHGTGCPTGPLYMVQGVPEDLYTWFRVSQRKPYTGYSPYRAS